MLVNLDAFDSKPVNVMGFSLGTLVAFNTCVKVKERVDASDLANPKESPICDVYLLGSVISIESFLEDAWKLLG